jgi:hypothetical protein
MSVTLLLDLLHVLHHERAEVVSGLPLLATVGYRADR